MLTFSEAVRKVGQRQPKSRFPDRSPGWLNTRTNTTPTTSAKVPHQSKTRPLRPGEAEPEEYSDPYHDLEDGEARAASDARSRARRPAVRRARGQEDATSTERMGQDDLGKIAEHAKALQAADPSLTGAQAFEKAYLAPANRPLANREFRQRMARLGA
jgi:hypothetical protein